MTEDEIPPDFEMRQEFMLGTDEGLAAWLYGFVDTLLMGDTLQPEEGDTPRDRAMKEKGRIYRDQAMKMLERLSGMDEATRDPPTGKILWASQNALSAALWGAVTDGIEVASYAAPGTPSRWTAAPTRHSSTRSWRCLRRTRRSPNTCTACTARRRRRTHDRGSTRRTTSDDRRR